MATSFLPFVKDSSKVVLHTKGYTHRSYVFRVLKPRGPRKNLRASNFHLKEGENDSEVFGCLEVDILKISG